jgi:uncharacterized protein YqfA (UPF0365 family)
VNNQIVIFIVIGVVFCMMLVPIFLFVWIDRLWVQCLLAGAQVSVIQLIMMRVRKSPVQKLCELYIMSVQAGLKIRLVDLERASLAGADVELVVRAMIKSSQTGQNLTWDEALQQAMKAQYDDYVEMNYGDTE